MYKKNYKDSETAGILELLRLTLL